jgi:transposase
MIDTQQQYIKLNIHGEVSIIVVQAHSGRKRDIYAHKRTHTYSHIYEEGGDEREHIHISGDSRGTLSRC